jgi:adenosyl cobinamide kinase/adenosyl cobinamide phosphate guanylyltransferase
VTLTLLIGGARSGKSILAVQMAARYDEVVFVATAEPGDQEMASRIDRHRIERPTTWTTVEEPVRLENVITGVPPFACLVIDCLTVWVSNLSIMGPAEIEREASEVAALAAGRPGPVIAVTNEVGLGIVPVTPLGRQYRDVLGRVNAIWAEAADDVYFVIAGRTLRLGRGGV